MLSNHFEQIQNVLKKCPQNLCGHGHQNIGEQNSSQPPISITTDAKFKSVSSRIFKNLFLQILWQESENNQM